MVATDGYRLAKFHTTLEDGISGSERYIVPSRALSEAARNLSSVRARSRFPHSVRKAISCR